MLKQNLLLLFQNLDLSFHIEKVVILVFSTFNDNFHNFIKTKFFFYQMLFTLPFPHKQIVR